VLRRQDVPDPGDDEVLIRTLYTGISGGTETSVFLGHVPTSEHSRMRAPFQEGEFPGPVKYGYLNVGIVEHGPAPLVGQTVFTLFPHQSRFVVPVDAVMVIPDDVPARRAVLAGAVETALNVLWDAGALIGDRIMVVGAGMIGCCIARLASGIPGVDVVLVDVELSRARVADLLGVRFTDPAHAPTDRNIVINASGSDSGLQLALTSVVTDGEVIEASWYGDRPVSLSLGADFHSRRLSIRSSQVGAVAARRRAAHTNRDRLALALGLLRDPAFDALIGDQSGWHELPTVLAAIADGAGNGLCQIVDWEGTA
jgi:threonine dehydrogenase-like Zn-dependent dehydrogenase